MSNMDTQYYVKHRVVGRGYIIYKTVAVWPSTVFVSNYYYTLSS